MKKCILNSGIFIIPFLIVGILGFSWCKRELEIYVCHYTDEKITIDGIFDESCWRKANKIKFYHLEKTHTEPQRHPAPFSPTTARLLWDKEYLYFAMEAEDKDIWGTITEHDSVLCNEDVLEIFLKPRENKYSYYEFEISPKNVTWDLFYPSRGVSAGGPFQKRWSKYESNLKSATKVYGTLNKWKDKDEKWTLEVAIPFSSLKEVIAGTPRNGEQWRFALCRYDYSVYLENYEYSSSARLSLVWFHKYEDYNILEFRK
ncbi:MAG: carbohydrate-binding family 9-like protein [bacterium]